ncbi:hypothetical protein [Aeromicrobium massiliense]|uniref:hypothetical protein n=1 Tax=Aeromicrobium massiliense TaxID=1464554 RepID=UPI000AF29046|nr:hypothetical protein [Aeromicrobium massiliense]
MSARRGTAVLLGGTALAGAALVAVPATASADLERHGRCAGATYELQVDREGRRYEVSLDAEHARPGSRWVVQLRHDGKRVHHGIVRADREGELELERLRPNTRDRDTFTVRLRPAGTDGWCSTSVRVR